MQGRERAILIEVAPELPALTVGIVHEMIDANEYGVALEVMSDMLVESDAVISEKTLSDVALLVDEMGLDVINVDRLRSRVER
ncbi:MAG: MafI family immunity protein [Acidimicrobiales bacterium]